MNVKIFAEKLNKELNSAGFPLNAQERAHAFSKAFKVPIHTANSVLSGLQIPSEKLQKAIQSEFELAID